MSAVAPERDDSHLLGVITSRSREAQRELESLSLQQRVALLRDSARALETNGERLVSTATRETHLTIPRIVGELARTASQFRLMADAVERGAYFEATIDLHRPDAVRPHPDLRRSLVPVGPVAVYAASNFPLAFGAAGTDTCAALAAGCSVVVKAHPLQPDTADLSVAVLRDAVNQHGVSADVIQAVHGYEAGRRLVQEPVIKAAAFTGSTAAGRALFDLATRRPDPIPFYGELGSVNPVLVTDAATSHNPEALVSDLARAITGSMGQLCTRPSLILVPAGEQGDRFELMLGEAVSMAGGGPMLSEAMVERFEIARDEVAARTRVRTLTTSSISSEDVSATVLSVPADEFLDNSDPYVQEIFGPYALVVRYADPMQLSHIMDVLPGSLTFTVRGEPEDPEFTPNLLAMARRRAGRILGAGVPTGVSVTNAQMHGGMWPAATSASHTSVGTLAAHRFLRPVVYQDLPNALLPPELQDANPLGIERLIDGVRTRGAIRHHTPDSSPG